MSVEQVTFSRRETALSRPGSRLPRIIAGPRGRLLARLLVNGVGQAIVTFGIAWLTRQALADTDLSNPGNLRIVTLGGLILAALSIFGLRVLERIDAERLGQDYVAKVRLRLFSRLAASASPFNEPPRFGLTMTRMITDLNGLKKWVSIGVARMSVAAITVFGCLVALAYFNLALAGAAGTLVGFVVLCAWIATPTLRSRVRDARRRRGALAANLGDKLSAIATVAHFDRARNEWRRLRRHSRRLSRAMVRRMQVAAMLRSMPDIAFPISIAIVLQLTVVGQLNRGEIVASLTLLAVMVSSLRDISRAWEYRVSFEESRLRLLEALAHPPIRESKRPVKLADSGPVSLEFENVHVRASGLEDISARFDAGARILLSGPGGSGKSTLLALAARFIDPDRGRVLLDGMPMRRLSLSCVHRAVQLVSPTLPLLRGTVTDNLAYGATDGDTDWIARVAEICLLDERSRSSTAELNERVAVKGQHLPEGLRARISLARAMVARPRLLLIDDPVFSTDPEAKRALDGAMAACNATVLMVALEYRASTYDSMWWLENGRITNRPPPCETPSLTPVQRSRS
ncbi:MAG: ABC transporter ATP-binding protein [Gammaproteobacteria bacterium]|nr:MAG: ABC transporter ATP-binding protein [Gammaproteobacteria bacterium]